MANDLVISLLRHGLTLENERKAYIGWTDSPLSDGGKRGLQQIKYDEREAGLIFSSPLRRCLETAAILFPNQSVIKIDELKEMHFGAWEGKTYDELRHLPNYRNWLTDIFTQPIDGGETFPQFQERILDGLQKVVARAEHKCVNRTAIVTHSGVIRNILHTIYPNEKSFFDWEVPFGGGYQLAWNKKQLEGGGKQCILLQVEPTMVKQIG